MLSCGETILASDAEVQEFYSLARALGMDKKSGESTVDGPEQQPPLPQEEGEEDSRAPDLTPMEEEADHQDKRSEEDGEESEGEELMGNSGKQKENEDKEKKFEELRSLIASGQIGRGGEFPCPMSGCQVNCGHVSSIFKHLSGAHLSHELREKRKAAFVASSAKGGFKCMECGSVKQKKHNLVYHYGVVHKDLADVALEKVALEVLQKKEQHQQQQQKGPELQKEQHQQQQPEQKKGQEQQGHLQSHQPQKGIDGKEQKDLIDQAEEIDLVDIQDDDGGDHGIKGESHDFDQAIKEEMFKKLHNLIAGGLDEESKMFSCPLIGCESMHRCINDVLYHLCSDHFQQELRKRRKGELDRVKGAVKNKCELCGSVKGTLLELIAHFGVVHKDIALVALERGILSINYGKNQQQGHKNAHFQEEGVAEDQHHLDKQQGRATQNQGKKQCQSQEEKGLDGTGCGGDGVIDLAKDRPRATCLKYQKYEERKLWKLCKSNSSAGFDCPLCKGFSSSFSLLLQHLCISHFRKSLIKKNRLEEFSQQLRVGGAGVRCTECQLTVKTIGNLIRHHGVVHKQVAAMALKAHCKKRAAAAASKATVKTPATKEENRVIPRRGLGSGPAGDAKLAKWARLKSLCPGLSCPFCTHVVMSGSFSNLLQHMSTHHFRLELECKRPETRRGQHQLEEDGHTKVWKCKECTSKFAKRCYLSGHYNVVHGDVLDLALEELEKRRAATADGKEKKTKPC